MESVLPNGVVNLKKSFSFDQLSFSCSLTIVTRVHSRQEGDLTGLEVC